MTDTVRVMTQIRTLAVIVVLSLSAVACGGSTAETATANSPMPAGENNTISGAQIDLGSLEGQDTVLWFWAPW